MKAIGLIVIVAAAVALAGPGTASGASGSASKAAAEAQALPTGRRCSRTASRSRPAGRKQSLLGTIKRANGTRQVTYAGHPLYTYVLDKRRGHTRGEGSTLFGAGWDALAHPERRSRLTTTSARW